MIHTHRFDCYRTEMKKRSNLKNSTSNFPFLYQPCLFSVLFKSCYTGINPMISFKVNTKLEMNPYFHALIKKYII